MRVAFNVSLLRGTMKRRADPVGPALRAASLFPRVVKDKQRPANTLAANKLGEDRKGCCGGGFSSDEILMVLTLILESVLLIQIRCGRRHPPPPHSTAHFFLVQRCPPSATFDQPCVRGSFSLTGRRRCVVAAPLGVNVHFRKRGKNRRQHLKRQILVTE